MVNRQESVESPVESLEVIDNLIGSISGNNIDRAWHNQMSERISRIKKALLDGESLEKSLVKCEQLNCHLGHFHKPEETPQGEAKSGASD